MLAFMAFFRGSQGRAPLRVSTSVCIAWGALLSCGCGSSTQSDPAIPGKAKAFDHVAVDDGALGDSTYKGPVRPWAESTYSPRLGSTPEPSLSELEEVCGKGDVALHEVAQLIAEMHQADQEAPALDVARFHLRRRGSPYVMPRLWSATIKGIEQSEVVDNVSEWANSRKREGEMRCGVGLAEGEDGERTVSVLQTEVFAEVKPIATRVEAGEWIELEATMLVPTTSATVLLLPPEGRPKRLNTKFHGNRATARFAIETEGTWLVQLMATQSGGPRPVAGMLVTADSALPQGIDSSPVPGEDAWDETLRPEPALFELMNAARADQGLPALKRSRTLDRVAKLHSQAMLKRGRISHDTGRGDPARRVEMAGLHPKATGENVALAGSVVRLHRVLWASPSHRENLLLRRWDEAGVAIVRRKDGTLFATQLFADSL